MNTNETLQALSLADTKRLIDELIAAYEELVTEPSPYARDRAREATSIYHFKVLPDIEARLDKCDNLLRKGLRSEALDYASEAPDLIEVANTVDIERHGRDKCAQWFLVARADGLISPKMPDFNKVASLVEARDKLLSITPLLEKWKHQNLKREPIEKRLKTLRRLNYHDQTTAIWHTMLSEHEQHHITELTRDANKLLNTSTNIRGDAGQLLEQAAGDLIARFEVKWTTTVPPVELITNLKAIIAAMKRRRIDDRLDTLASDLQTQFAQLDTNRSTVQVQLQMLSSEWHSAAAERGGLQDSDPRLAKVTHILSYVKDITQYRATLNEIHHLASSPSASLKQRTALLAQLRALLQELDSIASRLPDVDKSQESQETASRAILKLQRAIDKERRFRQMSIVFSCL